MEIFRITRNAWGQETLEGMSWDLLPVAFGLGLACHHRSPGMADAECRESVCSGGETLITRPRAHRPRVPLGDRAGGAAAAGQRLPAHPRPEVLLGAAALDHGRGADRRRAVPHRALHLLPAPALHADLAATPARIRAGTAGGQVHAGAEAHARRARIRGAGGDGDRRDHARQGGHAVLEARSLSTGRIHLGRRLRAARRVGAADPGAHHVAHLFLVAAREARLPACHDRRADDARGSGGIS